MCKLIYALLPKDPPNIAPMPIFSKLVTENFEDVYHVSTAFLLVVGLHNWTKLGVAGGHP